MHQILGKAEKKFIQILFHSSYFCHWTPVEKGYTRIYTLPKNDSKLRIYEIREKWHTI